MKRILIGLLSALLAFPALAQIPGPPGIVIDQTPVQGGTTGECLYVTAGGKVGDIGCGGPVNTITVGSTTIDSGNTTRVLFNNAGVLGQYVISGTGNVAMTTSPVFTTPSIGVATATSINGNTITTGTGTLTIAAGKTLTANDTLTLAGTDATTMTFPATTGTVATLNTANIFTVAQTITVTDNVNPALMVTQSGTGAPALRVNDSTTGDSSPFVISDNGVVLIGSDTAQTYTGSASQKVQINGTSSTSATLVTSAWVAGIAGGRIINAKSRGASPGTHTVVQADDVLGTWNSEGSDGTAFIPGASIAALVDGTPGTNDMPTRLVFSTTRDGAAVTSIGLTIDNKQSVIANNAAIATNATDGFLYVAASAGTPTGVPTTYTGRIPIVVDSTNHKLYFYSGGAWRDAGP